MGKVYDVIEVMESFPVTYLPDHLSHDADIRLLVSDDACLTRVSIMALCDFGHVRLWKHARVNPNLDIQVVDSIMEGHECIWVEFNGIRLTRHDLAPGTVTLCNGDVVSCGYKHGTRRRISRKPRVTVF